MTQRNFFDADGKFHIKPYRLKELCLIYGISNCTFKRWLKPYDAEVGRRKGHFYSIQQVEFVIGKFGLPRKAQEFMEDAA